MMAVHFCAEPPKQIYDLTGQPPELKRLFHIDMINRGVYTAARGMIVLSLPMGETEFDFLADAFGEFLSTHRSLFS